MLSTLYTNFTAASSGRTVSYCAQKMVLRGREVPHNSGIVYTQLRGEHRSECKLPAATSLATCAGWAVAGCAAAGPTLVAKGLIGVAQGVGRPTTAILGLIVGATAAPFGFVSGLFRDAGPNASASQIFYAARATTIRTVCTAGAVLCGVIVGLSEGVAALCAVVTFGVFTPVAWLTANLTAAAGLWGLALMFLASDRFPWAEPTGGDAPQVA